MKKFFTMLLIAIMTLSLAACGSSASGSKSSDSKKSNKLVVWAWDQNLPSINFAIEKYKTAHPDSKLEVKVQNVPDTVDKMSTFFASGVSTDLPDMVLMDNLQIQTFLQQFPGKFVNLSKMGFDENKDKFSKAQWDLLSKDGSIYAFPFDIAPMMLKVNTEVMQKAGVDPTKLTTWDDFLAATKKVNDKGAAMHIKFVETEVLAMMQSAGVGLFDADKKIDLLNPKTIEIVELYKRLQEGNASDKKVEDGAKFAEGKIATVLSPAWAIGEDMLAQKDLAGKVTLVPMPKVKNEAGYTSSANNGGSSFFILNSSKNKDAAYEIGKNITTELESQKLALANGLMPGFLPATELPELNAGVEYYGGQPIWKMLLDSSVETPSVYVNEHYATAKEIFKGSLVDPIKTGSKKSAKELLQETADSIAAQTGLEIKKY